MSTLHEALERAEPFADPGDGIYFDMSREDYDALDGRANWSTTKLLKKSPAHFHANRKSTEALELGIAGHAAFLEPKVFARDYAVWRGPDRRTKEGKAAWAEFQVHSAGKTVLEEENYEIASGIAAALQRNPQLDEFRPWQTEVTVLWTVDGVACKCRLDILSKDAIIDMKTTNDASPQGFGGQAGKYDYLGQMAMQQDAVAAVTGRRLPVHLLPVEKAPPHVGQVYVVPDELLLLGRNLYRRLLGRLVEVRRLDLRHGYSTGKLTLQLPTWALGNIEVVNGN